MNVLLEYIDLQSFIQTLPIMLASCLMLLATYYGQNYAGIIGLGLLTVKYHTHNEACMHKDYHGLGSQRESKENHLLVSDIQKIYFYKCILVCGLDCCHFAYPCNGLLL